MLGEARPDIDWKIDRVLGKISVRQVSQHTPLSVTLWQATSWDNQQRDFRQTSAKGNSSKANLPWTHQAVNSSGADARTWTVSIEAPKDGRWVAAFLSLHYERRQPSSDPIELSTDVLIFPDTYPFARGTYP